MVNVLEKGFRNFRDGYYSENKDLYKQLESGQAPHTLMITCSDSRICPNHLTDTVPGELFVIRNAGNLIDQCNPENPSHEAITLEYAVSVLKVKNILVCGHTQCGAMAAVGNLDGLEAGSLIKRKLSELAHLNDKVDSVEGLIFQNVKEQIEHIKSYPFVQRALEAKKLNLIGWVYDFANATIETVIEEVNHEA